MENKKQDLAIVSESDLSLVESNQLTIKQLQFILKKTPPKFVKSRPAKGGGTWDFVSGGYVKKCLNLMFGWNWDFEIVDETINIQAKQVIVKGRLTCRSNGNSIVKMQYGRQDIKFRKGTDEPLDLGNDMKGAATDALKKCASEIGIAADIYNKDDFREVHIQPNEENELDKLQALFAEYEDVLSKEDKINIERIITTKDTTSYAKAIKAISAYQER